MKQFFASGDEKFVIEENTSPTPEGMVKVKITKIIPTRSDLDIFLGKADINYPFIPCHMAVGLISEERPEFELKRGTRVVLNPYIVKHSEKADIMSEIKTFGEDVFGFLSDFVVVPIENIIVFPDEVKEEEAVFAEYIAISLSAINSFKVQKGDYVAIIGGSPLCNLIAQLTIYFQAIPIVIDFKKERLQKAKECGIYYTIDSSKEAPIERVMEITGGRMAEHTILESEKGVTPHYFFSLARNGGDCTIVSVNQFPNSLEADINLINKKQLKVKGISTGASEFNSAVYILAQKFLNLSSLVEKTVKIENVQEHFENLKEQGFSLASIIEF